MNWSDYLIPSNTQRAGIARYDGELTFELPKSTKLAIIGVPEDRLSDGAGEIKSPSAIRNSLYALSIGAHGAIIVDMGNLRTGKTLADTYYGLRDVVKELNKRNVVTLIIGGTIDVFYGSCLALNERKSTLTNVTPTLQLPVRGSEKHPLNSLMFKKTELPVHICNVGYQSYYVAQDELDYFQDRHYEAYRLGEVKTEILSAVEPIVRDSDLIALSFDAIKHSDAPAAANPSPNGFTGEEACQIAFYAGLSHKCCSMGIFDMLPQNDVQNITANLAAQIAWYFIEGVKKRNTDNPKEQNENFKKYVIYFDELHHDLCFFKNVHTERWWMEVPSITNKHDSLIISCTPDDYKRATEQEIPERWWKTYQRINFK